MPRETRTKGDICKTLLTFNNEYTHRHTHNTPHARTIHIFVQQKCSKDLSGVCVWMFFFFTSLLIHTTRWRRRLRQRRRRRVYVGERVLLSHLYICRRNIGTLNSPAVLLKVKKVIYTSPSRPTMTPWK